jgi:hypothetical protein
MWRICDLTVAVVSTEGQQAGMQTPHGIVAYERIKAERVGSRRAAGLQVARTEANNKMRRRRAGKSKPKLGAIGAEIAEFGAWQKLHRGSQVPTGPRPRGTEDTEEVGHSSSEMKNDKSTRSNLIFR